MAGNGMEHGAGSWRVGKGNSLVLNSEWSRPWWEQGANWLGMTYWMVGNGFGAYWHFEWLGMVLEHTDILNGWEWFWSIMTHWMVGNGLAHTDILNGWEWFWNIMTHWMVGNGLAHTDILNGWEWFRSIMTHWMVGNGLEHNDILNGLEWFRSILIYWMVGKWFRAYRVLTFSMVGNGLGAYWRIELLGMVLAPGWLWPRWGIFCPGWNRVDLGPENWIRT